jgi:hypothetical protein
MIRPLAERPFYAPDLGPDPPRTPTPGFKLWELRKDWRVLTCEIREDEKWGAGVDVELFEDGELLVSQRCVTGDGARFVADSFRRDYLRTSWIEFRCRRKMRQ